jgi:hypothetical protein
MNLVAIPLPSPGLEDVVDSEEAERPLDPVSAEAAWSRREVSRCAFGRTLSLEVAGRLLIVEPPCYGPVRPVVWRAGQFNNR